MADAKTLGGVVGGVVLGIALGGGGGALLAPDKAEVMQEITVAEMVAAKKDSTTKVFEKADAVREAARVEVPIIDEKGEQTGTQTVEVPRAVVRPEQTIRVDEIPVGSVLRVVAFVDDKAVSEWVAPITEAPDAEKVTRASVQVTVYDQVR